MKEKGKRQKLKGKAEDRGQKAEGGGSLDHETRETPLNPAGRVVNAERARYQVGGVRGVTEFGLPVLVL